MGKKTATGLILAAILIFTFTSFAESRPGKVKYKTEKTWDIGEVISAFPVGFCLLTKNNHQFIAYYDKDHNMTIAMRTLDSDLWEYKVLPCKIGWDSHNYVTMALDNEGHLHISGNMHCVPLVYFRASEPWNISSLEKISSMCEVNENRCTYPLFMEGPTKELIFHYRDGSSGNGKEIYNVYDCKSKKWKRLLDKPLIDGEDKMNAYMQGPELGPDGWFYLCWVWRNTYKCETNHDLSLARSKDLIHWENLNGTSLPLPITIHSPGMIIDPVPPEGGILNGCQNLAFDSKNRPVISYHKFDADGNTQAYAARFESGQWNIKQLTNWDYRWFFEGGGSIGREISLGKIKQHSSGKLALPYSHKKRGSGMLIIDEETLTPIGTEQNPGIFPADFGKRQSTFPGMRVKTATDKNDSPDENTHYVLRWETLPQNRDRKPPEPHPEPSKLTLYKFH